AARRDPEFASRPIFVCTDAMVSSALARDADRAGATKIYNRKSAPIENILAEIIAHLNAAAGPSPSYESEAQNPPVAGEAPGRFQADVAWLRVNYPLLDRCRDAKSREAKARELWSK